ncbi:protein irg-1-like [Mytilus galloprovincialis]|uniref:protein irg-1-like n=1 Tax=Mytilus galloprovincialis TaxID=29158 RepID=UPI003F7C258A
MDDTSLSEKDSNDFSGKHKVDDKNNKPKIDRKNRFKENASNNDFVQMDDYNVLNPVIDRRNRFKDNASNNDFVQMDDYNVLNPMIDRRNRFKENVSNNDFVQEDDNNVLSENNCHELKQKALEQFVFFWKPDSPYSQLYLSEFAVEGLVFNSAEQFTMYSKAMLFEDEDIAYKVLVEQDPLEQTKFGRLVRNFDQELWDATFLPIVERGIKAKFSQDESLKATILETYPKTIVQVSPYDSILGIGLEENDPLAWDCKTWKGQNLLGKALTKVRDELKEEVELKKYL